MFDWFTNWSERRKIKKLVRATASGLRSRYGAQEFYTPGQVLKFSELAGLDEGSKQLSVAMYVSPELADGVLSKLNSSKSAKELRKYLIIRCFDNFSEGDVPAENAFMHASSHEGFSSGSDFFETSDGGHSADDSSGGHH